MFILAKSDGCPDFLMCVSKLRASTYCRCSLGRKLEDVITRLGFTKRFCNTVDIGIRRRTATQEHRCAIGFRGQSTFTTRIPAVRGLECR